MATLHPTAIVHPGAEIADDVTVGPFSIIDDHVVVGAGCVIDAHVRLCGYTVLGKGNRVHHGVVLGEAPQDTKFKGEVSYLRIGDHNEIREYATVHRATGEGASTVVGSHCILMAYSHIGHNAQVGDHLSIASFVGISGHCTLEDYAIVAGLSGVHQYVTVGAMAFIGGMSRVVVDVPPYCMAQGNPAELHGLNFRGLMRRGVSERTRMELKKAYRHLYRSTLNYDEALEKICAEVERTAEVEHLLEFQRAVGQGYAGRQRDPLGHKTPSG
jgi:UDP-N-acetylglucosamine acyltransferase